MPIRKLDLSPEADAAAQRLAGHRGIRVETLLERRLETDLRRGRAYIELACLDGGSCLGGRPPLQLHSS
jgi:hypothetical protein